MSVSVRLSFSSSRPSIRRRGRVSIEDAQSHQSIEQLHTITDGRGDIFVPGRTGENPIDRICATFTWI